jgi:hypothetical protein
MSMTRNPLNAHAVQTLRVLQMPGESFALPPGQSLDLTDIRARLDDDGMPCLADPDGRHLLPAHLGAMAPQHLSVLAQFLAMFGPGSLQLTLPPAVPQPADGFSTTDRMTLGRVVVRRRQWIIPLSSLPEQFASGSEAQAFEAFSRWRLGRGIPDRVFLIEEIPSEAGARLRKPQYLDLTSPLFLGVLRSSLPYISRALQLEEMLPLPESMPRDEEGLPWVVELQLDALALGGEPTRNQQSAPYSERYDLPLTMAAVGHDAGMDPHECQPPPLVEIY